MKTHSCDICCDTGRIYIWSCKNKTPYPFDLCSVHGGCLKGSKWEKCLCKEWSIVSLEQFRCPSCNELSFTDYKFNEKAEGKKCHCCQFEERCIVKVT